ncbi:AraC family transcriptional regulator [Poriferisphaera sp. WC338]|uniref:AraC family transcriptional regulator n=1 Tax=Poriferisphaera sp. WC338 TaxID=3425129 RepID=UPI003D819413
MDEVTHIKQDSREDRRVLLLREQGCNPYVVLGRYRYLSARGQIEEHLHPGCVEICYLESGRQTYVVEGEQYVLRGGDLFFTWPGELHSTGDAPEEKGQLYWLVVDLSEIAGGIKGNDLDMERMLLQTLAKLRPRHISGGTEYKKSLRNVFVANDDEVGEFRLHRVRHELRQFLLCVLDCAKREGRVKHSAMMVRVLNYIESHLEGEISIECLAELVCLSVSRFKHTFQKEVGMSPVDYVQRKRIDLAAERLHETNQSVSEIACAMGYSSSQYFATVFKRYRGVTPSVYRKRVKT